MTRLPHCHSLDKTAKIVRIIFGLKYNLACALEPVLGPASVPFAGFRSDHHAGIERLQSARGADIGDPPRRCRLFTRPGGSHRRP